MLPRSGPQSMIGSYSRIQHLAQQTSRSPKDTCDCPAVLCVKPPFEHVLIRRHDCPLRGPRRRRRTECWCSPRDSLDSKPRHRRKYAAQPTLMLDKSQIRYTAGPFAAERCIPQTLGLPDKAQACQQPMTLAPTRPFLRAQRPLQTMKLCRQT